jgi:uncharacterized protein (TIGR02186 family)
MSPVPALPPPSHPPVVSAALTQATVRVSSTFQGARIVIYGAVFNPGVRPLDVVVVVRGPAQPVRIVRKTRVAGMWINSRPVLFIGAPGFYMASSTHELEQIAGFSALQRLGLGVDHLRIDAPDENRIETRYGVPDVVVNRLAGDYLDWRSAVIRLKERSKLYDVDPSGVRFVDPGLFRAEVSLPTHAPTGRYRADVLLFQDGTPVSTRELTLTVKRVGIEREVYSFAHRAPWSYGIVSVAIALISGWLAARLFRRG